MSTMVVNPPASRVADESAALAEGFARRMGELSRRSGASANAVAWAERAAVAISRATALGHVCMPLAALARRHGERPSDARKALLASGVACLARTQPAMQAADLLPLVIDEDGRLYLARYFDYERRLAGALVERANAARVPVSGRELAAHAARVARYFGPGAGDEIDWQRVAALVALAGRLTIVSGGPGTGKTTTVVGVLACLLDADPNLRIALAAPTGKAAQRMQEALIERADKLPPELAQRLPRTSFTLQRLLGVLPDGGFRHHRDNPLPYDVIVVDEASMIDVALAAHLLEAVAPTSRLVMLGDKDQLSAVEAGAVFAELSAQPSFSEAGARRIAESLGVDYARLRAALPHGSRSDYSTDDDLEDEAFDMAPEATQSAGEGALSASGDVRRDEPEVPVVSNRSAAPLRAASASRTQAVFDDEGYADLFATIDTEWYPEDEGSGIALDNKNDDRGKRDALDARMEQGGQGERRQHDERSRRDQANQRDERNSQQERNHDNEPDQADEQNRHNLRNQRIQYPNAHHAHQQHHPLGRTDVPLTDSVVWLARNYRFGLDSAIGRLSIAIRDGHAQAALDALEIRQSPAANGAAALDARAAVLLDDAHAALSDRTLAHLAKGFAPYADALSSVLEARRAALSGMQSDETRLFDALNRFRVLCAMRKGPRGVDEVNARMAAKVREHAGIPLALGAQWFAGRPIIVTRNDYALGLFNGDIGIALPGADGALRVAFRMADGSLRYVSPAALPPHDTAFALTVHKSQGSEFEHAALVLPGTFVRVLSRELVYTAITRAKRRVEVIGSAEIFAQAVTAPTRRDSGLAARMMRLMRAGGAA
ncbi:AAA family ATPase [Caballeronia sp. LZ062]|uniref:AAA family ATPase n=1 Tax=unclassified Caballeronia TaxID=2646786 RepID=UPI002866BC91|nr:MULTISPECIES: AAA family ATPase [unclassified Caballeronia]MDR5854124.1 AAA family ATPase [Caballeronia sp. LZ050]MDR5871345.1 AAA family ATPase [Caballeronia sp. LZ062]